MLLNPDRIDVLYDRCTSVSDTKKFNIKIIHGIRPEYLKLDKTKIKEVRDEVNKMIECLAKPFHSDNGWTFLNIIYDNEMNNWTNDYFIAEKLVILGIATDKLRFTSKREEWKKLPNAYPYIKIIEPRVQK